ncbi:MAG: class I SAM-dependent methyltransferase [Elusimicrobia bacterium]|nr:class I SAM-dependent methyltransferase [Elusimicrobiota bacterium]
MNGVPTEAIGQMFSALAPRYRLFNRWSSLGLDDRWRRCVVNEVGAARRVLDLGTGTGDLALRFIEGSIHRPFVVGLDLSLAMLDVGRTGGESIFPAWVQGNGNQLPFITGVFNSVVSAFVLRNLFVGGVMAPALREVSRVLEVGGRAVFLDLTRPRNIFIRWGHGIYSRTLLPLFGRGLFGNKWPGAYLSHSIRALPPSDVVGRVFLDNGFSSFECRPLWGGIVSLFIGKK